MTTVVRWRSLALVILIAGCGRDPLTSAASRATDSLRFVPERLDLFVGQRFAVDVVRSADGRTDSALRWPDLVLDSRDPSIAFVLTDGQGTASGPGTTVLEARLGQRSARANVTVRNAQLTGLVAEPVPLQLAPGEQQRLRVFGRLTDGRTLDLNGATAGTSYRLPASSGFATVDGEGLVQAIAPGRGIIEIRNLDFLAAVPVVVSGNRAPIVELSVEPNPLVVGFGQSRPVQVSGRRSDGTVEDVTDRTVFSDASPLLTIDADGLVTAGNIPATVQVDASVDGVQTGFEVTIISSIDDLVGLFAQPSALFVTVGASAGLQVFGQFLDGSVVDLSAPSAGTVYESLEPRFLEVSADGVVTARAPFDDPITVIARNGTFEAVVEVFIIEDVLVTGLEVEPLPLNLFVGDVVFLRVNAAFSDGSRRDISGEPDLEITTLPQDIVELQGTLLRARTAGRTQIRVDYQGLVLLVPVIIVEPTTIDSLELNVSARIQVGETSPVSVLARLADGRARDLTHDPALTLVSNAPAILGTDATAVFGVSPGVASVFARYRGFLDAKEVEVVNAPPGP